MFKTIKKFNILLMPILILILISLVLYAESMSLTYRIKSDIFPRLPAGVISEKKERAKMPKTCLLLINTDQEESEAGNEHIATVLNEMRIGFDTVDVAKGESQIPSFSDYKSVIIAFYELDAMIDEIVDLANWVENEGGNVMFTCAPVGSASFRYLKPRLDIIEGGESFMECSGMIMAKDFMIGGDGFNFDWNESIASSQSVRLGSNAVVYAYADGNSKLPLVWSNKWGEGKFVMNNHGISGRGSKGLTAAAVALMDDVSIYPVINASTFFLDDFPAPVPYGNSMYIQQFYKRSVSSFYTNNWWNDLLRIIEDYGLKFTGVVIEDYNELVDPPFTPYYEKDRFLYFGSMLLDHGGEIGIHGYNHMPLVLPNFDLKSESAYYKKWPTEANMAQAINEVQRFTKEMFPNVRLTTYVPPSNILSPEGRALLKREMPELEVVASVLLGGESGYQQDFGIAEDGIVEFPRIVSGTIFSNEMQWEALNGLNMYYVNSHFMHPDDVLDEERGADLGWEFMREDFIKYIEWVQSSAPNLRNLTARDGARAIQRYDTLSFERIDSKDEINLRIFGFWDEADFMIRINEGAIKKVSGGKLEHVSGSFYSLRANTANVTIEIER